MVILLAQFLHLALKCVEHEFNVSTTASHLNPEGVQNTLSWRTSIHRVSRLEICHGQVQHGAVIYKTEDSTSSRG